MRPNDAHASLATDALDFDLPEDRIATRPAEPRDAARLLVFERATDSLQHLYVRDLPDLLAPGDRMVVNTAAVVPARLRGHRTDTGGAIGGLFLHEEADGRWLVLLKSNGRLREGQRLTLDDASGASTEVELELERRDEDAWVVAVSGPGTSTERLERVGLTPLPPYILRARGGEPVADAMDRAWYQTTYANDAHRRSVAAPTAGLHFTPEVLDRIEAKGIPRWPIVLDVGAGTFKPVTAPTLAEHAMHRETYLVPADTRAMLARHDDDASAGRLVAVGTTTVRVLESLPHPLGPGSNPIAAATDLLIAPGFDFRRVDVLMTNFHLPRSTLLALVGALVGLERLLDLYREAIGEGYRFYSYGDAMLVL
ncbi:MAG: tRNA preQ1(34) S-adenosylmethionine ribosyltransferase-isomerase QueA [Planctomycetota bacterium]